MCFNVGQVGAAVLGVPVKPTIKEVDAEGNVVKTLQRAALWDVQTPQVLLNLLSTQTAIMPSENWLNNGMCWGGSR